MAIEVHFQHWQYEITSDYLTRYGSPFFSKKDAGHAVWNQMLRSANRVADQVLRIDERGIVCGNEAYPESALADPLADLSLWDEWESGIRVFPYPGKFSRLGLTHQEPKIAAPSSVCVLGEIMTGYFAQAMISPDVLVRVIRHWPDFIFFLGHDVYAFIESKAFTQATISGGLQDRLPAVVAKELLVDAVHQLNADPHLEVWGVFTGVASVQPHFTFAVTAVQISPPASARLAKPRIILPDALVHGLAQRAISQATLKLPVEDLDILVPAEKGRQADLPREKRRRQAEVQKLLIEMSEREIEELLAKAGSREAVESSRNQVELELKRLVHRARYTDFDVGRRFFEIKQGNNALIMRKVRTFGAQTIFMANLEEHQMAAVRSRWRSDFSRAAVIVGEVDGFPIWQCGGALFCVGPDQLEGRQAELL